MEQVSGETKRREWRQGSVFSPQLARDISKHRLLSQPRPLGRFASLLPWLSWRRVPLASDDILIVISHSCDLVHHDLDSEPYLQVLLARKAREPDGNLTYGKNVRRLQFDVQINGEEIAYEALAHEVFRLPRTVLSGASPDDSRLLLAKEIDLLKQWVVKRYSRVAFPDEFNGRISKVSNKIRKLLKKQGERIEGVYVLLETDEELSAKDDYRISIVATMLEGDHDNPEARTEAESTLSQVEAHFGSCEGIEILETFVKSEAEFSLSDLRVFRRWDLHDDLSLR